MEGGSLSGGIVCGALGISSVGTGALVCSVLGGATGGALLGSGGSEAGGKIGLHLYEEGAW